MSYLWNQIIRDLDEQIQAQLPFLVDEFGNTTMNGEVVFYVSFEAHDDHVIAHVEFEEAIEEVIYNLTPHDVTIIDQEGNVLDIFPPEEVSLRATKHTEHVGRVMGINVERTTFVVSDLPPKIPGTWYIVPKIVAEAAGRKDFLIPGAVTRDEQGRPLGCMALSQMEVS
jgi:hypothetical protein